MAIHSLLLLCLLFVLFCFCFSLFMPIIATDLQRNLQRRCNGSEVKSNGIYPQKI